MTELIRLTHVITDLDIGGAETMLLRLVSAMDSQRFELSVVSLTNIGSIGSRIAELGIPVDAMNMRPGRIMPADLGRLSRKLKSLSPHIVQTWLYHSDLLGGLAAHRIGVPVVWNVRSLYTARPKLSTLLVRRACALMSNRIPARIVTNAAASEKVHVALGYPKAKMIVIPNGFDADVYRPDDAARESVRTELRIPDDAPILGHAARFHPQKDHRTFLEACAGVRKEMPECRFVLCGTDITPNNKELNAWITELGLEDSVYLLGPRDDMPRLYSSMDVLALSSRTEAFPNVVAEAMLCGVPCAVSDVGDAASIVGETGAVVPPGDSHALSQACLRLLRMEPENRAAQGIQVRTRIEQSFGIRAIVARYESLYQELALECAV